MEEVQEKGEGEKEKRGGYLMTVEEIKKHGTI